MTGGRVIGGGLALLALAGCNNDVIVRPVIETPTGERVFAVLDTIELTITLDGESEPLVSLPFRRGEPLELPGVPYGENLVLHMVGRVNNSEIAYGRTCRFAVRAGEPPPTPHVYFARTGQWALSVVPPNPVRIGGAALTSGSGSALYLGGRDASNENVLGADRFDPTTGVFEQLALLPARINGSAATLGDGRAILVGGVDHDDQIARHIDLISIDADSTQAVTEVEADQLGSISGPGLATLNDGTVVAFGGRGPAGQTIDLATRIASEGSSVVIETLEDARLAFPRYGHSMTRLSDDLGAPVLIAGGRDQNAMPVATSELYRPLFELVAPLSEFGKLMQVPRWDHAAVRLPDGGVLIVGGRNVSGPVGSLEVFTLEAGFIIRGFLPAGSGLTDFSVTSLPDGRVLIAGGRDSAGELVDTVQIVRIDPFNGGIDLLTTAKLSTERAGHTAALLCDGTVLVVGGTLEPTPAERYNPPSTGRL